MRASGTGRADRRTPSRDRTLVRESRTFIAALTHVAPATRRAYERELEQYVAWLLAHDISSPRNVTPAAVELYARQLSLPRGVRATAGRGYAAPSRARKLSVVRAWHRFLARERDYPDPTAGLAMPRASRAVPRVLTPAQVQSLLNAPSHDEPLGQRDHALLALLYYCGVSAAEAAALRREDWDARRCRLRHGRVTGDWPAEAGAALTRFLGEGRRQLLTPAVGRLRSSPLLPGRDGKPLGGAAVHRIVQFLAERCGLPPWVTPRTLRDSRANHLREGGADLRHIAALLGHASVVSTESRTRTDTQRLRETYEKAHPRA